MQYLSIIPARGGSKGLPNKNILPIAGKPLIAWSIEQSLNTAAIGRTIVSTDCENIANVSLEHGAEVPFFRPSQLANDVATTESALMHCIDWLEREQQCVPDAVILLQCTSPVRAQNQISKAIELFESSQADSLLSVSPFWHFLWTTQDGQANALYNYKQRPRRQDIKDRDKKWKENGSIYITKTKTLKEENNRLGGKIALFEMTEEQGWEIDSQLDFTIIESILKSSTQL